MSVSKIISHTIKDLNSTKDNLSNEIGVKKNEIIEINELIDKISADYKIAPAETRARKTPPPSKKKRQPLGAPVKKEDVRDWIVRNKTFSNAQLGRAFNRTTSWGGQTSAEFINRGIIRVKGNPARGKSNIYEYVAPVSFNSLSDSGITKDKKDSTREISDPIPGTGSNGMRSSNKDIQNLINISKKQGFEIKKLGSGHIIIVNRHTLQSTTLPSTPSDYRSISNARAELNKIGVTNI